MTSEFDKYFTEVYKERWSLLKAALLVKEKQVLRKNFFSQIQETYGLQHAFERAYWMSEEFQTHQKELLRDQNDIFDYYIMDPASYLAVLHFPIRDTDKVLDMCAAPGGKSLILAEKIFSHGELIANELSESRRSRLIKVVQNYIPKELRQNIWVKGWDAQFFGLKMPDNFDKVLLDAPCSGERHQLENQKEISEWSVKKAEKLAIRQYSLLASAYLALKSGGQLMYSTCSINPMENDQVIQKLVKKKKNIRVETIQWSLKNLQPEKTDNGYIFLPDKVGFGPIFFSLLTKL